MTAHGDFFITGNFVTLEPIAAESAGAYMYEVKELYKTAGWSTEASGDGTAYDGTSDLITSQAEMNTNRAWVRVVSPDLLNEFCFQMVVVGANHRCRVKWNGGSGATFTNGGSATETPGIVGGVEHILVGGGTDASPDTSSASGWWHASSATQNGSVAIGAAMTVAPYMVWTTSNGANAPYPKSGNLMLDYTDDPAGGDTGYVGYSSRGVVNGGWDQTILESVTSTQGSSWALIGGVYERLRLTRHIAPSNEIPENSLGESAILPVFWHQGDDQTGSTGLFGPCNMLKRNCQHQSGNLDQREQFDTVYGNRSHIFANEYALPWPSLTTFSHSGLSWPSRSKALYDITLATAPNAAPPTGGGTVETNAPVVQNLTPTDMSELARDSMVTFDAVDVDSEVNKVLIWAKFEGDAHTELVFDGDSFVFPFDAHSTVTESASTHSFSIQPTGGWTQEVSELTVKIADIWGNFDGEDGGPGGGEGN